MGITTQIRTKEHSVASCSASVVGDAKVGLALGGAVDLRRARTRQGSHLTSSVAEVDTVFHVLSALKTS